MYHLPYREYLKPFSRKLRLHSTLGEVLLWQQLRAGAMMGYHFNRQKPLGKYIVDFYCKALQLVIEVDGEYHFQEEQMVADEKRQKILESYNLNFLRFTEKEVCNDRNNVLRTIENYIIDYEERFPKVKEKRRGFEDI